MARNGMVQAGTLQYRDKIEVPVETCMILGMRKVPGQLKNRKNYLVELTVVPLSGPWSNIEGKVIVESSDLVPLVERERRSTRRWRAIKSAFSAMKEYLFGVDVQPIPTLPSPKATGPMT